MNFALLDQRQSSSSRDRFGHRGNPKKCILLHRDLRFSVLPAKSISVRKCAMPVKERDDPGDLFPLNISL